MGRGWVFALVILLGGCNLSHPPKPFADEIASARPIAKLEQGQKSQVLFLNSKQPRIPPSEVPLRAGETVITGKAGTAQIRFSSLALSRLASDTRVTLQSIQSFRLEGGSAIVSSPEFWQLETDFGRVTAKNAVVYVTVRPDRFSHVLVLKGKAHSFILDSDVKVVLSPGEELSITPWGIPYKRKKLNNEQKRQWLQRIKKEFQFTDRLPTEVVFLEKWQIPLTKPKPKRPPARPSIPYQAPDYPVYAEQPYYYDPEPPAPIVRAAPPPPKPIVTPPPPPAPVYYEPPPLPPEPELIPSEPPPVATEPIPMEQAPDENVE
ncbi:MAG: FecR family protein [Cyanobacteria bacterium KgW148]|nr:FecR family protein [Cyanobacteria bacterium KgW148]